MARAVRKDAGVMRPPHQADGRRCDDHDRRRVDPSWSGGWAQRAGDNGDENSSYGAQTVEYTDDGAPTGSVDISDVRRQNIGNRADRGTRQRAHHHCGQDPRHP